MDRALDEAERSLTAGTEFRFPRKFVVRGAIFVDATRPNLAASQEGINIWSCACSAMLVRLYASQRRPPWGMC